MGSKSPFPLAITNLMNMIEDAVKSGEVKQLHNFIQTDFSNHAINFSSTAWKEFVTNPYIKIWKTARHRSDRERWACLLRCANKTCHANDLYVINMEYFD